MSPMIIDIALVIIALLFVIGGYRQGFVRAVGSLIGLSVSIALGIWGVGWLERVTGINLTASPVVFIFVFLILSVIASQLLGLLVSALDMVRKMLSIIPGVGLLNSLLGAVVGALQAGVLIAALAFIMVNYVPTGVVRGLFLRSEIMQFSAGVQERFNILQTERG